MNTSTLKVLTPVMLAMIAGTATGTVILSDSFDSGTVAPTFRIYENRIDDGWGKSPNPYSGQPASAWTITGGQAENASSLAATGYPDSKEAEAPLYNFFSGVNTADTHLRLRFDYSVAAGDLFYAHLWGMTGVSDDDGEFISNIEASANGNVNTTIDSTELVRYNLLDGAATGFGGIATAISGELTGSGTFDVTFSIAGLGIGGVTTAADLNYYVVQFAKQEDGTAGTTSIDNFSLSAVPEPSALALLASGFLVAVFWRRRFRN